MQYERLCVKVQEKADVFLGRRHFIFRGVLPIVVVLVYGVRVHPDKSGVT